MSTTQGSDLFRVSRSSRDLQDTRSSTLETHVAGPLRLVAGEVASSTSFILTQSEKSCQLAKQCDVRLLVQLQAMKKKKNSSAWFWNLSKDLALSKESGFLTWYRCHQKIKIKEDKKEKEKRDSWGVKQTQTDTLAVRAIALCGVSSHL